MHAVTRFAMAGVAALSICGLAVTAASASGAAAARTGINRASAPAAAAGRAGVSRAVAARAVLAHLRVDGSPAPDRAVAGQHRSVRGLTDVDSFNWSGYADIGAATYSKVAATWTEPAVTCTSEDRIAAFWVGIDGYSSNSVEQDGTLAQCFEGTAYYYTWWEMYPTNAIQVGGDTVRPGDKITSSVSRAGHSYTLAVTDATTRGNNVSTTQACAVTAGCANSSAEWIGEAPTGSTGEYPLAKFAPWKVTAASVATTTGAGGISAFPDSKITMTDSTQTYALATPGALAAAGAGFTDTWRNSF
jgi:hypothetical protein